jgi:1-acyl-sn-glycerol-3-phosphate acyltransferase
MSPPSESPRDRRDRISTAVAAGLVLLAVYPVFALLLHTAGGRPDARIYWFLGLFLAVPLVVRVYWSPYRILGSIPLASVGWLAAVVVGVWGGSWPGWPHGLALGLIGGARSRSSRQMPAIWELVVGVLALLAGLGLGEAADAWGRPDLTEYLVLAVAAVLVVWSWWRLFRPLFELAFEPLLWVSYRVRGAGPGLADFPRAGPCLVLANHACWLDPLFLAKVLPRPVTPMMTGRFYDLPVLRRIVAAFGVIRVPEKALKRDAPEVGEAVAALDRGECVVVFPEGYLRRTEDRPLRRFGQGVWQILKARPETPVYACWVEGGWGSYTSYRGGPPTKGKRPDFRRRIGVGVSAAAAVPAAELAEHLPARVYLMNLVAAARAHLGLPPLEVYALAAKGDDREDG